MVPLLLPSSVSATSPLARLQEQGARWLASLASFHLNSHEIYSATFPRRVETTFTTFMSLLPLPHATYIAPSALSSRRSRASLFHRVFLLDVVTFFRIRISAYFASWIPFPYQPTSFRPLSHTVINHHGHDGHGPCIMSMNLMVLCPMMM